MDSRFSRGEVARLYLDIISAGAGVIGQGPTAAIQRIADGSWFQASDGTWQPTIVENVMSQTDSASLPGRYHFDFDQSLDTLSGSTRYITKMSNVVGTLALKYEDLVFGPLAGAASLELCSVQGTVFDPQGNPSKNQLIRAILIPGYSDSIGRSIESDRVVATYTNDLGDFDIPLVRGGTFRLEIPAIGYDRRVLVPDQASVLFTDL